MAQILILFENEQDRRLLKEYLSVYHQVHTLSASEIRRAFAEPFDLCILDSGSFAALNRQIPERKKETPLFLPFLLVLSRTQQQLKLEAREIIDAVMVMPISHIELQSTVETLLRARSISLKLNELLEDHQIMLSIISHDIRSPLSAIQLQAELLLKSDSGRNSNGKQLSISILNNAKRIDRMIADLMDLGRKRLGSIEVKPTPVLLKDFLSHLVANEHFATGASRIRNEIADQLPVVMADPGQLDRIFTNLISNSLKYAPGSEVVIRSRADRDEVVIEVSDHGPGIDTKSLPRVFEAYYRVRERGAKAEGLGLGLYITKLLVEANGGRIWVVSQPGKGTTFSFSLPVRNKVTQRAA